MGLDDQASSLLIVHANSRSTVQLDAKEKGSADVASKTVHEKDLDQAIETGESRRSPDERGLRGDEIIVTGEDDATVDMPGVESPEENKQARVDVQGDLVNNEMTTGRREANLNNDLRLDLTNSNSKEGDYFAPVERRGTDDPGTLTQLPHPLP